MSQWDDSFLRRAKELSQSLQDMPVYQAPPPPPPLAPSISFPPPQVELPPPEPHHPPQYRAPIVTMDTFLLQNKFFLAAASLNPSLTNGLKSKWSGGGGLPHRRDASTATGFPGGGGVGDGLANLEPLDDRLLSPPGAAPSQRLASPTRGASSLGGGGRATAPTSTSSTAAGGGGARETSSLALLDSLAAASSRHQHSGAPPAGVQPYSFTFVPPPGHGKVPHSQQPLQHLTLHQQQQQRRFNSHAPPNTVLVPPGASIGEAKRVPLYLTEYRGIDEALRVAATLAALPQDGGGSSSGKGGGGGGGGKKALPPPPLPPSTRSSRSVSISSKRSGGGGGGGGAVRGSSARGGGGGGGRGSTSVSSGAPLVGTTVTHPKSPTISPSKQLQQQQQRELEERHRKQQELEEQQRQQEEHHNPLLSPHGNTRFPPHFPLTPASHASQPPSSSSSSSFAAAFHTSSQTQTQIHKQQQQQQAQPLFDAQDMLRVHSRYREYLAQQKGGVGGGLSGKGKKGGEDEEDALPVLPSNSTFALLKSVVSEYSSPRGKSKSGGSGGGGGGGEGVGEEGDGGDTSHTHSHLLPPNLLRARTVDSGSLEAAAYRAAFAAAVVAEPVLGTHSLQVPPHQGEKAHKAAVFATDAGGAIMDSVAEAIAAKAGYKGHYMASKTQQQQQQQQQQRRNSVGGGEGRGGPSAFAAAMTAGRIRHDAVVGKGWKAPPSSSLESMDERERRGGGAGGPGGGGGAGGGGGGGGRSAPLQAGWGVNGGAYGVIPESGGAHASPPPLRTMGNLETLLLASSGAFTTCAPPPPTATTAATYSSRYSSSYLPPPPPLPSLPSYMPTIVPVAGLDSFLRRQAGFTAARAVAAAAEAIVARGAAESGDVTYPAVALGPYDTVHPKPTVPKPFLLATEERARREARGERPTSSYLNVDVAPIALPPARGGRLTDTHGARLLGLMPSTTSVTTTPRRASSASSTMRGGGSSYKGGEPPQQQQQQQLFHQQVAAMEKSMYGLVPTASPRFHHSPTSHRATVGNGGGGGGGGHLQQHLPQQTSDLPFPLATGEGVWEHGLRGYGAGATSNNHHAHAHVSPSSTSNAAHLLAASLGGVMGMSATPSSLSPPRTSARVPSPSPTRPIVPPPTHTLSQHQQQHQQQPFSPTSTLPPIHLTSSPSITSTTTSNSSSYASRFSSLLPSITFSPNAPGTSNSTTSSSRPSPIMSPSAGRAAALAAAAAATAAGRAVSAGRRGAEQRGGGVGAGSVAAATAAAVAAASAAVTIVPPFKGEEPPPPPPPQPRLGSIREVEEEEEGGGEKGASPLKTLPKTSMMEMFKAVVSEYSSSSPDRGGGSIGGGETDEELADEVKPFHALPIDPSSSPPTITTPSAFSPSKSNAGVQAAPYPSHSANASVQAVAEREEEEALPLGVDESMYATLSATSTSVMALQFPSLTGPRPSLRPLPGSATKRGVTSPPPLPVTTPSRMKGLPLPHFSPPPDSRHERLSESRLVHSEPLHADLLVQEK